MMLKMQKNVLTFICFLLGFSAYSQSDDSYPYFRIASIPVRYSAFDSLEIKYAENEQFKIIANGNGVFDANCLLKKFTFIYRNFSTGVIESTAADSFVYANGKPVRLIRVDNGKRSFESIFSTSADSKIDTILTQNYNNLAQITSISRTILYRNRLGKDSLFKDENFQNGTWQLGEAYHEFFYDNAGYLVKSKLGGYYFINSSPIYLRRQTTNYIYSGNSLTTKIDSFASALGSPTGTNIGFINQWQYKYDAFGRLLEGINSSWSSQSPDTLFTQNIRNRYTAYNSENKSIAYYTDNWKNNTWVETNLDSIRYANNNLTQSFFQYTKNGSNWWLNLKNYRKFCGILILTQEISNILDLKIYPNPAQNSVTLEGDDNATSKNSLQVFDYAGRLILQQKKVVLPHTVDVSKLSNGLYFFKINNEKGQSTTRKVLIMK